MSFEDYCKIGSISVKYSMLKVYSQEKEWDSQRRKLIRRKKGEKWIDAEISNDYAQFVVGQSLSETNYFEESTELCYRTLGISVE